MNDSVSKMMPSFTFDNKVSLGNLMSAAIVLVSVIGAYFALDNRTGSNADNIVQEAKTRQSDVALINGRLSNLEGKFEALVDSINRDRLGSATQMTQMQSDVSYVKSAVEDMRRSMSSNGPTSR